MRRHRHIVRTANSVRCSATNAYLTLHPERNTRWLFLGCRAPPSPSTAHASIAGSRCASHHRPQVLRTSSSMRRASEGWHPDARKPSIPDSPVQWSTPTRPVWNRRWNYSWSWWPPCLKGKKAFTRGYSIHSECLINNYICFPAHTFRSLFYACNSVICLNFYQNSESVFIFVKRAI